MLCVGMCIKLATCCCTIRANDVCIAVGSAGYAKQGYVDYCVSTPCDASIAMHQQTMSSPDDGRLHSTHHRVWCNALLAVARPHCNRGGVV